MGIDLVAMRRISPGTVSTTFLAFSFLSSCSWSTVLFRFGTEVADDFADVEGEGRE